MRKRGFSQLWIVIVILVLIVIAGAFYFLSKRPIASSNVDSVQTRAMTTSTAELTGETITVSSTVPVAVTPFSSSSSFASPYAVSWYSTSAQSQISLAGISINVPSSSGQAQTSTITLHLLVVSHINIDIQESLPLDYIGLLTDASGTFSPPIVDPSQNTEPLSQYDVDAIFAIPQEWGGNFVFRIAIPQNGGIPGSDIYFAATEHEDGSITVQQQPNDGLPPPPPPPSTIASVNPAVAPPGAIVSVAGSGFAATDTVEIGSTTIPAFISNDGSSVAFQVPPQLANGTYTLSVNNSSGASNPLTFTSGDFEQPSNPTGTVALPDNQITWFAPGEVASTTLNATYTLEIFGTVTFSLTLNKVGVIQSGEYQGGTLVMANSPYNNGKGLGTHEYIYRFILYGKNAILLPQLSSGNITLLGSLGQALFSQIGMNYTTDNNFIIPELEYPQTIIGPNNNRQVLTLQDEQIGTLDSNQLVLAFTDPQYGNIYTTNPSDYLIQSFFNHTPETSSTPTTIYYCLGSGCYKTNAFFVFRPDGTYLRYAYQPDFNYDDVMWNDGATSSAQYTYQTIASCNDDLPNQGDYEDLIPPSLVDNGADLVAAGTNEWGDTIYTLSNNSSSLSTNFYNLSVQYDGNTLSYDQFLKTTPLYFWYDPFGRLVRFENTAYVPFGSCEPVIYLYPTSTEQIHVQVNPLDGLTATSPTYSNGWSVIASPDGAIYDPTSNTTYPYLFWEGRVPRFPLSNKGFVVQPSQVPQLFSTVLPELGLNQREASDFEAFWEPKLQSAPYYFITFYTNPFINSLAPLDVSPKPDTVIRVLMDFEELQHPINVQPLQITTSQRNGFTVVEWGGIERPGWVE